MKGQKIYLDFVYRTNFAKLSSNRQSQLKLNWLIFIKFYLNTGEKFNHIFVSILQPPEKQPQKHSQKLSKQGNKVTLQTNKFTPPSRQKCPQIFQNRETIDLKKYQICWERKKNVKFNFGKRKNCTVMVKPHFTIDSSSIQPTQPGLAFLAPTCFSNIPITL